MTHRTGSGEAEQAASPTAALQSCSCTYQSSPSVVPCPDIGAFFEMTVKIMCPSVSGWQEQSRMSFLRSAESKRYMSPKQKMPSWKGIWSPSCDRASAIA